MKKPFVLGMTGPTGAGKSTVGSMLAEHGFFIIDADKTARKLTEKGSKALSELAKAFGEDIISPDGELVRPMLAQRAFKDAESAKKLNAITHPAILELVRDEIEKAAKDGNFKIVLDAPQLIEAGGDTVCDFILSVLATKETRIARITARDGISRQEALMRINAQKSDEFFIEHSDFVIYNDANFCKVNTQIDTLFEKLEKFDI